MYLNWSFNYNDIKNDIIVKCSNFFSFFLFIRVRTYLFQEIEKNNIYEYCIIHNLLVVFIYIER